MKEQPVHRTIVVPIIKDEEDRVLICRMPADRGVFPGQWGLPGGGIEPGETMEEALRREVREELGAEVSSLMPLYFKDKLATKRFADGTEKDIYMIFLIFRCTISPGVIALNDEFDACEWVDPAILPNYDLNEETRKTFGDLGLISYTNSLNS